MELNTRKKHQKAAYSREFFSSVRFPPRSDHAGLLLTASFLLGLPIFLHCGLFLWLTAAHTLQADSAPCAEATSYSCCCGTNAEFHCPSFPASDTTLHSSALAERSWQRNLLPTDWQKTASQEMGERRAVQTHRKLEWGFQTSCHFIYSNWTRIKRRNKRWAQASAEAQWHFYGENSLTTLGFTLKLLSDANY